MRPLTFMLGSDVARRALAGISTHLLFQRAARGSMRRRQYLHERWYHRENAWSTLLNASMSRKNLPMLPRPTNMIEVLTYALRRWMEIAFPEQQVRDVESLWDLWMRLADAITFPDGRGLESFYGELRKSRGTSRDGDPPIQALEQRLRELVAAGIRTCFLVIAVREALDELIGRYFPATLSQWQEIADSLLPLRLRLTHTDEEAQPSSGTYWPQQ